MMNFDGNKEERQKWWNVVVLMPDNSIRLSFARGEDYESAKRWFDRATYTVERSDYKEILEFSKDCSSTYNEFVEKENKLKDKYNIK